jgi:ribosome-binding protein aMBF1 (putative translation factor)
MNGSEAALVNRLDMVLTTATQAGISHCELARAANVHHALMTRWKSGDVQPRQQQVVKLRLALARLRSNANPRDAMVWSVYRAHLAMQAVALGLDVEEAVWADPAQPNSRAWRNSKEARHRAIYMTVTALGVSISEMADTVGIKKQAVSKLLREVEDARDCPKLDGELQRLEDIMTGCPA